MIDWSFYSLLTILITLFVRIDRNLLRQMVIKLDVQILVEGGSKIVAIKEVGAELREGAEDRSLILSAIVTL